MDKDKADWLRRQANRMKLLKPKGRDSPRQIAADEEYSRQKAYNMYIELATNFVEYPNEAKDIEHLTEEEFFQEPVIEVAQSSSEDTRLKASGKKARGDSGAKQKQLSGSEASANTSSHLNDRKFIVDSGASFHLISIKHLKPKEKEDDQEASRADTLANCQWNNPRHSRSRRIRQRPQ